MAIVQHGIPVANGVILGTANTDLIPATTNATRTVITYARVVNYGVAPIEIDFFVLLNGQVASNEFKSTLTKTLAVNQTYLISELIGVSIDLGGSIVGTCNTAVSAAFSAVVTEITP